MFGIRESVCFVRAFVDVALPFVIANVLSITGVWGVLRDVNQASSREQTEERIMVLLRGDDANEIRLGVREGRTL